jgi:protein-S-isoprenylcysteine O-methyltransferase Ste14
MPAILAAVAIILMVLIVLARIILLRRLGIQAMNFGRTNPTDFLIPPFALFYLYLIVAHAFGLPTPARSQLFQSSPLAWMGVLLCLIGLLLMAWSVISFGRSFRVGIDAEHPGGLVTSGAFAVSRNPIYTAFAFILLGQFLVFPHWLLLVYLLAGFWLLDRQSRREEAFLQSHYGDEYTRYRQKVRRYL